MATTATRSLSWSFASGSEPSGRRRQRIDTALALSSSSPSASSRARRGARRTRLRGVDGVVERRHFGGVCRQTRLGRRRTGSPARRRARRARRPRRPATATFVLSPVSRRTTVTLPSARSRGPTSTRTGMPFSSWSTERRPNATSTRSSSLTRTSREFLSTSARAASPAPSSSRTTTMTHCVGASEGGKPQPAVVAVAHDESAEQCASRAPRRLPHVVGAAVGGRERRVERAAEVLTELVQVPICSALPSPIIPSIVHVYVAPAKRSRRSCARAAPGSRARRAPSPRRRRAGCAARTRARRLPSRGTVWPSCHRNSVVRRNRRGRSSQRTTLAH